MNSIQELIRVNYGIGIIMQTPTNHISRGNVFEGYNNDQEYIIKIESKTMAFAITELMLWTKTVESVHVCFPRFLQTIDGNYYVELDNNILSIQHKEDVQELKVV